ASVYLLSHSQLDAMAVRFIFRTPQASASAGPSTVTQATRPLVVNYETASSVEDSSVNRSFDDHRRTRFNRQIAQDIPSNVQGAIFLNNSIVEDGPVDIRGTTDKQWLSYIVFADGKHPFSICYDS